MLPDYRRLNGVLNGMLLDKSELKMPLLVVSTQFQKANISEISPKMR